VGLHPAARGAARREPLAALPGARDRKPRAAARAPYPIGGRRERRYLAGEISRLWPAAAQHLVLQQGRTDRRAARPGGARRDRRTEVVARRFPLDEPQL